MVKVDLNKKQQLVYSVIQAKPWVANNDADLIAAVWRKENWDDGRSLEDNLRRVSRPETITRRRRELFNLGLITYTEEALEEREEAFINERDHAAPVTNLIQTSFI